MLVTPLRGKAALAAHHTTADLNVYEGSVRSGKTVTSLIAWLRFVLLAPPGELLLCGRTERTVKRNIVDVLTEMLGPSRCRFNAGQGELHLLGRRVYVVGANDTRSEEKIRGLTLVGAYVDEASKVPESFWQMLRSRLSVDGAMLIASTNPDSPNHWLKENWLDRASLHLTGNGDIEGNTEDPINLHRFSFRLADNPNLSSRFVENITRDYKGLWYRRFILGEWVAAVGAIYEVLDPAIHHAPAPPLIDTNRLWLGIDYGTSNPTHAVLLALVDAATDHPRLHVVAEWRHDGRAGTTLTDPGLSKRLAEWLLGLGLRPEDVDPVLDPSAASFRAQLRADGWARLKAADNRVLTGIRSVAALLDPRAGTGPLLAVDTVAAPALWKELTGYVWDPKAQAAGKDEPRKVDDHGCLIAGTMVATPDGQTPIEGVRAGDLVLTRRGPRSVLAAGMTDRAAAVYRLDMADGRTLTGTGNHPVWTTGRGWTRIDALRYGMILEWLTSSPTEGSSSGATPTRPDGPSAPTSPPESPTGNAASADFTRRSTGPRTVPRRLAGMFTTWTVTTSTTIRATSKRSHPTSTKPGTATTAGSRPPRISWLGWLRPVSRPLSGTALRRDALGTPSTAAGRGWTGSTSRGSVSVAVPTTRPGPALATSGSARTPARQPNGATPVSMTSPDRASAALPTSPATATPRAGSVPGRVLSVTRLDGRAAVYNLTVQGQPEFFANGILVHNCDALRYAVMAARPVWRRWITVLDTADVDRDEAA